MPPPFEDLAHSAGTIAGWVTAASVAALVAFKAVSKTFFAIRKDARTDRADEGEHKKIVFADGVYHQLIESLKIGLADAQTRLSAMDNAIDEMGNDLRMERAARMEAEDRAVACERDRVVWLGERVNMLQAIANCKRESEALAKRVTALEKR